MKKQLVYGIVLALLFGLGACATDEDSVKQGSCPAPTLDGEWHQLDSDCRAIGEEEHIRIEGLTLGEDDNLQVRIFGDDVDSGGYVLSVYGDGTVTLTDGDATAFAGTGVGVSNQTICGDLHDPEDPDHILIWAGSDCDADPGDEAAAIYNSEEDGGISLPDPDGSVFAYKGSSSTVEVDKMETGEPIFEEGE